MKLHKDDCVKITKYEINQCSMLINCLNVKFKDWLDDFM